MKHHQTLWRLAFAAMGLALLAAGCSGASKEDLAAAQSKANAEQQKAAALQQQLAANQAQVADLQKKLAAKDGVTPLIYAQQVPTPTPRPAPTAPPPGFVAPPPVKPPAELVNEVVPFVVYVETLATSSISKDGFASFGPDSWSACSPNAIFKRGSKLVWRYEVFDTRTGKRVTDQDGSTTKIVLPGGQEMNARYSRRGGVGPWMWAVGWDIPLDYALGALDWSVKIETKDGRSATWKVPFLLKPESPGSRPEDSRVQIVA